VPSGGTGQTSLTANNVILGNGTSAVQFVAPGSNGNILTSNGTTWTSAAPVPSTGTITAIASGALSNGDKVVVNSDGTVSVVSQTIVETPVIGSVTTVKSATSFFNASVYDASENKVVIFFRDDGNSSYGTAVVGTIAGTTITFGTPVVFESSRTDTISAVYDSFNKKIVVAYFYYNVSYGYARVGTVSGTTISFGNSTNLNFANSPSMISTAYDSLNKKVIIAYKDSGDNQGYATVGTVSGTNISLATPVNFINSNFSYLSIACTTNGKVAFAYNLNAYNYGFVTVGQVSGNTISMGTLSNFTTDGPYYISTAYDPVNDKLMVAYRNSNDAYGYAIVGTISGTSISFGSSFVFENTTYANDMYVTFDPSVNKMLIAYTKGGVGTILPATISGSSLSFGTKTTFVSSAPSYITVSFDSSNFKSLISFRNTSNGYPSANVYSPATFSTNLTSSNFIGISNNNYLNGQTATIQTVGSVDDAQSGLTPGLGYYVVQNNTLSSAASSPSVFAGTALSSTTLLIKG
jgi:hypothetical protein